MDAAAAGTCPELAYDARAGGRMDKHRTDMAGFALCPVSFVCLFLKGDWGEQQTTMAFPTFSHNYHPCPICYCPKEALDDFEEYDALGCPYALKTYEDVDKACNDCEVIVVLTLASHAYIRARLDYDRRKDGQHGRVLLENVAAAIIGGPQLVKADRLEPSPELMDIGEAFDELCAFPHRVLFWRITRQTIALHRNPLWNP